MESSHEFSFPGQVNDNLYFSGFSVLYNASAELVDPGFL